MYTMIKEEHWSVFLSGKDDLDSLFVFCKLLAFTAGV